MALMRYPTTQYAERNGALIAYQVFGRGQTDLLLSLGMLANCDEMVDAPGNAEALARLAAYFRVILFDRRGTGRSDPLPMDNLPSWEDWADDLTTVLDATGSRSAVIHGERDGALMALMFAASHPERCEALSLSSATARYLIADDYPIGKSVESLNRLVQFMRSKWGTEEFIRNTNPHKSFSPEALRVGARILRGAATPRLAAIYFRYTLEFDARAILPTIAVPTVIFHRSDNAMIPISHGRYIAERIPAARFIELPGDGMLSPLFLDDAPVKFEEWVEFVTGATVHQGSQRKLATVLFCDIVDSTRRAADLTDSGWYELLARFYAVVRSEIARFGGQEIATAGDGFFVSFDRPSHAIRCATAIRDAVHELDLQVRGGVHTGECLADGSNLAGMAVHIGARIASLAEPDQVWVSDTVKALVAGSGINFAARGVHELKGVPDSWALYSVE